MGSEMCIRDRNRAKFGQNTESALTEWEKNQIRPIFREFAEEHAKKGITKEQCAAIMPRLATDECIIGKIPNVTADQYDGIFASWQTGEDGLVTWH